MTTDQVDLIVEAIGDGDITGCGTCRHHNEGFCKLYLEPVEYADTCQRWTNQQTK